MTDMAREYVGGYGFDGEPELTGEEIVRCRDCKHLVISNGYFECGSEQWEGYAGLRCEVKPDGFCAWASKRKEGGE